MKRPILIFTLLLCVLGAALWWIVKEEQAATAEEDSLLVHCAAGFRKPMTQIARQYEAEFGVSVRLQFGGSGALASQLEIAGGDLFLPADESYLEAMREDGGLVESFPVARLQAGIVVPRGNPKGLVSLRDLGRKGLRLCLGEESASIGKHTWSVLEEEGLRGFVQANVLVTKFTVNNVVEDVATGAVDAAIAWDAVAQSYPGVEWVAVPEFSKRAKRAEIGLLSSSEKMARARHFANFVTGQGREVFEKLGFAPAD